MRRVLLAALLLLGGAGGAWAQPTIGNIAHGSNSSTSVTATISTGGTNRVLVAALIWNNFNTTTISDGAGLTWTFIGSCNTGQFASGTTCNVGGGGALGPAALWCAVAPAQLTSDVVTATHTGSVFNSFSVVEVSGTFGILCSADSNAGLPAAAAAASVSINTTQAHDCLFAVYRLDINSASLTSWTAITNTDFLLFARNCVTSTQTNATPTYAVATTNGSIGWALTADTASASGQFISTFP